MMKRTRCMNHQYCKGWHYAKGLCSVCYKRQWHKKQNPGKGKGDTFWRVMEIIRMFEAGPVTLRDIQDRFEISRNAALQWRDMASLHLPITEAGVAESTGGRPSVKYKLIK